MQRLSKRVFRLIVLISLCIAPGCRKFVEVAAPDTMLTGAVIFSTDQGAIAAVNGVYQSMVINNLSLANGGMTLYPGLSADELVTTIPSADLDMFLHNEISPDNIIGLSRLWSIPYKTIYQANAVLEGLADNYSHVSDTLSRRLRGEMLFVRAFHFFYLVNLFGAVPLTVHTDYRVNRFLPRANEQDVYEQVLTDLADALTDLPEINDRFHPCRYTALALLARVQLYLGKWTEALQNAEDVIHSGYYQLEALPGAVFSDISHETIWQLPVADGIPGEASFFSPSSSQVKPPVAISASLLASFHPQDRRIPAWMGYYSVGGNGLYYPQKYRTGNNGASNYVVLRLAEMYLICAECRMRLHWLPSALTALNEICARAGLLPVTASDETSFLQLLMEERRHEFFAEWGHRWLDLKRAGWSNPVLGPLKGPDWQNTDELYPILTIDINRNQFLSQNPGY